MKNKEMRLPKTKPMRINTKNQQCFLEIDDTRIEEVDIPFATWVTFYQKTVVQIAFLKPDTKKHDKHFDS